MTAETATTTASGPIPAPPAGWFAGPDRERIARRVPGAQVPPQGWAAYPLTPQIDPDEAARVCSQIQAGSRRAVAEGLAPVPPDTRDERVIRLFDAANCFAGAAAAGPDDEIGRRAGQWARDVRAFAATFVTVPAPSEIRPEVPRAEAA